MKYINLLLATYGYQSKHEFLCSIMPSFKYDFHRASVALSAIIACVSGWMGFTPVVAVAMLVAIFTEVLTGIWASKVRGEHFESFKFSRCVIKACIWFVCIFIAHSFYREFIHGATWLEEIAANFMLVVKIFIMVLFCFEYISSILENCAEIDHKPKETYVKKMGELFEAFFTVLLEMFKKVVRK